MAADRFAACLARVLQSETSYSQPEDGITPFVRFKPTKKHPQSPLVTGSPDGNAYDDDPKDTGGRTCMGLLQREYNAYRKSLGVETRDVWLIDDAEIRTIYRRQYWDALRCDDLPPGVDFAVFDSGVNCGIGMGARFLQRALGVKADGHIGMVTLSTVKEHANLPELVSDIIDARRAYHRVCRTAKYHLDGWLRRDAFSERVGLAMVPASTQSPAAPAAAPPAFVTTVAAADPLDDVDTSFATGSTRATPPDPAEKVADTNNGKRSICNIASAISLMIAAIKQVWGEFAATGITLTPSIVFAASVIATSIAIIAVCRQDWIDRGIKLIKGV